MKTTKKEFKEQVRKHILEAITIEKFPAITLSKHEDYFKLKITRDDFEDWYNEYEQKQCPNKHEAFTYWMNCLPSGFNIEYTNYGIYETLKSWFENCGEVYKERTADEESNLYYHLVFREFSALCKDNNITF